MSTGKVKRLIIAVTVLALAAVAAACGAGGAELDALSERLERLEASVQGVTSLPAASEDAVRISRDAADVPPPIDRNEEAAVVFELETVELDGYLADGTTFNFWTFDGTVPGPMLRVREGDMVEIRLSNHPDNSHPHNIDLHAVKGPGGGAEATVVTPGEEKAFRFRAMQPGLYVYHCAVPHVPTHVAHGMYGLILVEPAGGLPQVDKEFYVVQGDFYTNAAAGVSGHAAFDGKRLLAEDPSYVVFNGQFQALTGEHALKAEVGDRVRIFVGNGGTNLVSSFHVIGEIFDTVHQEGATVPARNVQTTLIPAGGAAWVEFTVAVPGSYVLVDHSLSRALDKGAVGILEVSGDENPDVFEPLGDVEGGGQE